MPQDVIASNYQRNLDEKDRQVLTYQQNLQLAVEKVKGVHSLLFKIMLKNESVFKCSDQLENIKIWYHLNYI